MEKMMHPEDEEVYKDILLDSLQQAIDEGCLELSLHPALLELNAVPGVVTVGSCEGHPDRNIFTAFVDLRLSQHKWDTVQAHVDDALERFCGLSQIQFIYYNTEDGMEQEVRILTHPMVIKSAACDAFSALARWLQKLHDR